MLARVEVWCIVISHAVFSASHLKKVSTSTHRRDENGCSLPALARATVRIIAKIDSETDFGNLREPVSFDLNFGETLIAERLTGERKTGRRALARRKWGEHTMIVWTAFGLRADSSIRISSKAALRVTVSRVPGVEDANSAFSFANTFACLVGLRGAPPPLCMCS